MCKKLIIIIAVLTVACLSGCLAAPANTGGVPAASLSEITETSAAADTNTAEVTRGTLKYSNEYINVDISYPQISGLADIAQQQLLNTQIFSYLKSAAEQAEADSREQNETQQYYYEAGYTVKRNDGILLSIREDISVWNGGAQENDTSIFINYLNTSPGKILSLSDIFEGGSDYIDRIDKAIKSAIESGPYAADYSFSGISDSAGFYISGTALSIVFDMSAIAPSAMGEPEFSIPLADLKDILIPEFGGEM